MNAPERIFAGRTITGTCVISFFTPSEHYSTEYIRADVAADMVATALSQLELTASLSHDDEVITVVRT